MAWIESHQSLADHPKTRKLGRILGIPKVHVIGHLHYLWWWALDYAEDGNLQKYDDLDIAIGAEWEGDPAVFIDAMVKAGFLDSDSDGLRIHDWDTYAGRLVEQRQHRADRARRNRGLYNDDELVRVVRSRDGDYCRYCGIEVDWKDRKGSKGGTYDHVDPELKPENTPENVVVACRGCSAAKGRRTPEQAGMSMLPAVPRATTAKHGRLSAVNQPTVPNQTVPNQTKPVGDTPTTPAGDAPAPSPEPAEAKPKPRSPKQQAADRRFERYAALFAAWCRGIGLDPESDEALSGRDIVFRQLKGVVDQPAPTPEEFERCTRYLTRQTWRDEVPKVPTVLGSFSGWVAKGRPDIPEAPARASPQRNGYRGKDIGLSNEELMAIARGERP